MEKIERLFTVYSYCKWCVIKEKIINFLSIFLTFTGPVNDGLPPVSPPVKPATHLPCKAAWEHKLLKCYTVAATPGANFLHLLLEIESTDNAVKLLLNGLIDCGATSNFIDLEYITVNKILVHWLLQPIPVFNVDSSPNEAGSIQDVANVVLRYNGHSKQVQLAVTGLGKQKLIFGYSWLWKHNSEINWDTQDVKMSWCPSGCMTCTDEMRT